MSGSDRLYVFGAGASVPSGLPTLKTLTWDLCQSLDQKDRELFLKVIYEACGVAMDSKDKSPDFEDLLNRLDPMALHYLEDTRLVDPISHRPRAFGIALRGLRHFIRERCLRVAHEEGPYDRLVHSLNDGSTVVSFNWDVLLEQAFKRAGRAFAYLPRSGTGTSIILKPHGSINWFALLDRELLMLAGDSNLDVLSDAGLSDYMSYVKDPLADINFGSSSPFLEAGLSEVPAIVPPNAARLLSVGGQPRDAFVEAGHERVMKRTWTAFKSALDVVQEIVVVGYSLPGTDAASIELFRYFAQQKAREARILLVDQNPDIAKRYKMTLGVDARIVCSDFSQFDPAIV